MIGNGKPVQAVATVEMVLLSDGRVVAKCNVPNRMALHGIVGTGLADLDALYRAKEEAAKKGEDVEVAPPGFKALRNDQRE